MFNLLKSDLRRIVRMRAFWVHTILVIALVAFIAGMMNYVASPEFAEYVNTSIAEKEIEGMSAEEAAEFQAEAAENLDEAESINDKSLESITYTWGNTFLNGGALGILGSLLAMIFLLSDFKHGFIRNLPMDRRSRWKYYGEKMIFVAIIQAYLLALFAFVTYVAYFVLGFTYETVNTAGDIALWLLLAWLYASAMALIVACVTWLLRSEAISSMAAVFISGGILGAFLIQIIYSISAPDGFLARVPQWLLISARSDLNAGGPTILESSTYEFFSAMPVWGHEMIVCLIYILAACAFTLAICRKRAVA